MTDHVRGWTARVGLRKPGTPAWARSQLDDLIRDEWELIAEALNRPIDHDLINGPSPEPNPTIRETARDIWDAIIGARPCCHSTGPNHHPACQEAK